MDLFQTVGVVVFVLRRRDVTSEVLLVRRTGGAFAGEWGPLARPMGAEESELEAAIQALGEEAAVRPERLYATAFAAANEDPQRGPRGRLGVFVAFVAEGAEASPTDEGEDHAWLGFDAARARSGAAPQHLLVRVHDAFVRRPPDEALRVA